VSIAGTIASHHQMSLEVCRDDSSHLLTNHMSELDAEPQVSLQIQKMPATQNGRGAFNIHLTTDQPTIVHPQPVTVSNIIGMD